MPDRRQVFLDIETTGLEADQGHRIIEIGAVELVGRQRTGRRLHFLLNPERDVDEQALKIHGLAREDLADKPKFAEVCAELLEFLEGAELVIHNARFDLTFLDAELLRLSSALAAGEHASHLTELLAPLLSAEGGAPPTASPADWSAGKALRRLTGCEVTDSLTLARSQRPGKRNDLDSLCVAFGVDNRSRVLHGALRDTELLVEVYLGMTGGQEELLLAAGASDGQAPAEIGKLRRGRKPLKVIHASAEEIAVHEAMLAKLAADV